MTVILHIESSSNLQSSFTRQIGALTVQALQKSYPDATVTERDLITASIPHVSPQWLAAASAGKADAPELALSNTLLEELFASDILVIEAPMYNFGIPSVLKAWIDQVVRVGKTFHYTANGPEGLVKGKKAILVVSRGGIYSEGPYKAFEHQDSYLRAVLGFIGITDVDVVTIEGVALGADKAAAAMESAKLQAQAVVTRIKTAA